MAGGAVAAVDVSGPDDKPPPTGDTTDRRRSACTGRCRGRRTSSSVLSSSLVRSSKMVSSLVADKAGYDAQVGGDGGGESEKGSALAGPEMPLHVEKNVARG